MTIIEIHRPNTDRPAPARTLRVTVLGVVSPLAEGDALRELIEGLGAEMEELSPGCDVAGRFHVLCDTESQAADVRQALASRDRQGHVLVEDAEDDAPLDDHATTLTVDGLALAHLPGVLRSLTVEAAHHGRGTSATASGFNGSL
jgi:hypothetical protein